MLFSEHFNISVKNAEWFDPILTFDTKLFIDPFLLYDNEVDEFVGSHQEIIAFFELAFKQVASSRGNKNSYEWKKALELLLFPEIEELCLGYTGVGTGGLGSGIDIAKRLAAAFWKAIKLGIENIDHFEQVQIFEEKIGPDRISDATAGVLKHRFAKYTARICQELGIPTIEVSYRRSRFSLTQKRWISERFLLPHNPFNKRPVLLVPKRYLRPLPTINAQDYWEYCFDNQFEALSSTYGDDISRNVDKKTIVDFATHNPKTREEYVKYREKAGVEPYDFNNDPRGFVKWYGETKDFVVENPRPLNFSSAKDFEIFIDTIISEFRNFIENNGGWSLLWNENETPKREEAAQLVFLGITKHYCAANNVDVSKEVNIGRGPVDFKVSNGHTFRALIELKLISNTRFWNGLSKQLPKYLEAENTAVGHFVAVAYSERDIDKVIDIESVTTDVANKLDYELKSEIVDARRSPISASKL